MPEVHARTPLFRVGVNLPRVPRADRPGEPAGAGLRLRRHRPSPAGDGGARRRRHPPAQPPPHGDGGPSPPASTGWPSWPRRGTANRDIAQALFVTAKTVEVHLSACYRKLGITSRADLAARLG